MTRSNTLKQSLAHTGYNFKYHIVLATKYKRKVFYNENWQILDKL